MTREEGAAPLCVPVRSAAGDYEVMVGAGLLSRLPELVTRHAAAHRYAVISDDRVAGLYGEGVVSGFGDAGMDASLFTFPHGEAHKTRKQWSILTDALLVSGFGRDTTVIALGGGVSGDLAGFVASKL